MRRIASLLLIPALFISACEKDDDSKGGGDCGQNITFELVGTKADGDGVPAFLEQMELSQFKNKKSSETKDATGKVTRSSVYEYDQWGNQSKSTRTGEDGVMESVYTATYSDFLHITQSVDQTYAKDGKSVESTETTVYEYVGDSRNLAKYTTTVVGGTRDGAVSTTTMTYDSSGRLAQSVDDDAERTTTLTYDYAANSTKETRLDKSTQKSRVTETTYRSVEFGEVVMLSEKETAEDGSVTVFANTCTDVGRRVDCKGSKTKDGKETETQEGSIVLVKANVCGKPYLSEHELRQVKVSTGETYKTRSENTDDLNAAGIRETVRSYTFDAGTADERSSKSVTTYDESGQNEVKVEDFESDKISSTKTYTY